MPRLNSNARGDLFVRTNVSIPRRLSDEQREMVKRLADSLGDKVSDSKPVRKGIFNKFKEG